METYEEKVKRLAETWEPFATTIEDEITAGWFSTEPTKLMRAVSAYLSAHNPIKSLKFEQRFFRHLN